MSVAVDGRSMDGADSSWTSERGLLLGDGLFETLLVTNGRAPLLGRHIARMAASARALAMPWDGAIGASVTGALPQLWQAEDEPPRALLRITLSAGRGRGLERSAGAAPTVLCELNTLPERPSQGLTAVVVDRPRIDAECPLAGHKTLSRLAYVHARQLARAAGADVALLLTADGDLCEADAANLFVVVPQGVVGYEVVTPPLDRGVLPGITRERVIEALGLSVVERRIDPDVLSRASEVFLTSSLSLVQSVTRVAKRDLAPGPIAAEALGKLLAGET